MNTSIENTVGVHRAYQSALFTNILLNALCVHQRCFQCLNVCSECITPSDIDSSITVLEPDIDIHDVLILLHVYAVKGKSC